ncbi:helix-turn-helix domain-containing protein [Mesoterricola silvestris]|uniref:HTH cro/C1-type domain-containing protein n=1 Tax=Mesoterricola silvestris TaxID=2927979 RepID=A0AA48K8I3_9BACT|nr:helix-turn-helix transcriptional regulator [Mesoterricola silvestris]BDU72949.1 hypothetical protein METEAL_21230 [Mesoterricola silvestris]
MSTVGERIKEARESRGFTQEDLAGILRTSRTLISAWERDETVPRGSTRIKIANALGCDQEWLRTGSGPRELRDDQSFSLTSTEGVDLLVDQYLVPAHDLVQAALLDRGIKLENDPLARVVFQVAMKALSEKRNPNEVDVEQALFGLIKG